MKKRGAIELSVGTIVIVVLAMTMLILGLVLIRSIFSSSIYNVEELSNKVKEEIGKLFSEDKKMVVYLSNHQVEINQGDDWGVAWAVKNLNEGTVASSKLSYVVEVSEDPRTNCGISSKEALTWIKAGRSESNIPLSPGTTAYNIVRMSVPKLAPLCTIRYRINAKLDNIDYATEVFDVKVTS